ncbi:LysR family transcriptional regulator [Loigolactobacillus bifermentans]|uniref:Transcription regulator n=1 Tax=Loigolactobacillus bifermentans DSM 20003 TaxID=1423726 RepID=A0A0R1H662_9LACO|nr:LysR family transcriptional regulator [Loigolactobacillus bifermentans]KRK40067.1 transcription regulator [Loigolactobacillus bifermentans DSM 20003]QGG61610.1 LysR family transcriptional regulator [Loigolactobacillus bifermentans]
MNLRHLEFFKELARTQHVSKAAENLGISQPSLSYAIKKLETELGVPLFEPDGRNIKLTALGRQYLVYINAGLESLEQGNAIIHQLNNPDEGHVSLGFTYTMGQRLVPELLKHFSEQPANAKISFDLDQNATGHLLQDLLADKYDVVLASHAAKVNDQETANLFEFTPIVQQEIKLALPLDHPLLQQDRIYLKDLTPYDFIMFSQKSGLRPLIDRIFQQANIQPQVKYELVEDHTIIGLVQYGMGIALVPNLPQLDQSQVALCHIADNHLPHQLYLITRKNHFLTPSVQRFEQFVRQYCQQTYTDQQRLL